MYVGLVHVKSDIVGKTSSLWCGEKVWKRRVRSSGQTSSLPPVQCGRMERGVPAQVSPSSSDHSSKLRGPSQISPRVASNRDVNITKLN
ncbi:hypothetical protein AVEN_107739-1 [Araneus ventricosus]|uniref:Uncharacterized protein n=1 Tax=Araneus ventricosus TaxID=182803 RepID=A0A4Y2IYN8_ARAVE|nr:hypothetical protein AVEN_107739-1 [Araneus ventricosus]